MGSSIRSITVPLNPQWKPAYDPADSCIRPHCAPIGIIGVICLTVSGFADRGQDVPERVRICRPQAGEGGGWVFWLDVWFVLYLGLIGLVVGSFLNVVVWRLPRRLSIVRPPSACPKCGRRLAARDLVPVLSWLFLRGRCRYCGAPIAVRYPLVEAFTGLLFAWFGLGYGLSLSVLVPLAIAIVLIPAGLIARDAAVSAPSGSLRTLRTAAAAACAAGLALTAAAPWIAPVTGVS